MNAVKMYINEETDVREIRRKISRYRKIEIYVDKKINKSKIIELLRDTLNLNYSKSIIIWWGRDEDRLYNNC